MPTFTVDACELDVARRSVIVDTGVLVGAFLSEDETHPWARLWLDECREQFVVPLAVVVEAWGFIVGARKNWQAGLALLAWLHDPGHGVLLVPQTGRDLAKAQETATQSHVDCVDAFVMHLADDLTRALSLSPPARIATCDLRDFTLLWGRFRLSLLLLTHDGYQELDP